MWYLRQLEDELSAWPAKFRAACTSTERNRLIQRKRKIHTKINQFNQRYVWPKPPSPSTYRRNLLKGRLQYE